MIEPMFARIAGCLVFAGLLAAMISAVTDTGGPSNRDAVAAAEIKTRVASSLFTRP